MADLLSILEAKASACEKEERFHRRTRFWAMGAPVAVLAFAFAVGIVGVVDAHNGATFSAMPATAMAVVALVTMLGILIAGNCLFATRRRGGGTLATMERTLLAVLSATALLAATGCSSKRAPAPPLDVSTDPPVAVQEELDPVPEAAPDSTRVADVERLYPADADGNNTVDHWQVVVTDDCHARTFSLNDRLGSNSGVEDDDRWQTC